MKANTLKKTLMLTVVVAGVMLGGCSSMPYDNMTMKERIGKDGEIHRDTQCRGGGCDSMPEIYRDESHNSNHSSAFDPKAAGKKSGNERYCRDFPEAKSCKGS